MTDAALLLAALLALSRPPAEIRRRLDARRDAIVAQAARAADAHGVPVGLLLVVAFLESHVGQDRGSGGCWGAPASPRRRNVAGTAAHSARALARSFEVCGGASWLRAVTRYRSGRCVFRRRLVGYEAPYAIGLVARVYQQAGLPPPPGLR